MILILIVILIIFGVILFAIILPRTEIEMHFAEWFDQKTRQCRNSVKDIQMQPIKYPHSRSPRKYEKRGSTQSKTQRGQSLNSKSSVPFTSFSPSSYTQMFLSNELYIHQGKENHGYSIPSIPNRNEDNSLIENMRLYHQNPKRRYQRPSPNPLSVDNASREYWNQNSPNSQKHIIDSASNPTIEYVEVKYEATKHVYDNILNEQRKAQDKAPAQSNGAFPLSNIQIPNQPKEENKLSFSFTPPNSTLNSSSSTLGFGNFTTNSTSSSSTSTSTSTSNTTSGFTFNFPQTTPSSSSSSTSNSNTTSGFSFNFPQTTLSTNTASSSTGGFSFGSTGSGGAFSFGKK